MNCLPFLFCLLLSALYAAMLGCPAPQWLVCWVVASWAG
jgi:hypothetical protein